MNGTASVATLPSSLAYGRWAKPGRLAGAGVAIVLHALVLHLALQFEPVRSALTQAAPIMVRLVSPAPAVQQRDEPPRPLPAKPRVPPPRPATPVAPLVATPIEAPSNFVAPPAPPLPQASPEPMVPAAMPAASAALPAPPAKPAPPVLVIAPGFNADYLNNPAPAYPPLSRRMGEEGRVVLRVFVNEQGLPAQVELRTSSGFSRLDAVALETVRQWRFVPARRGDTPVGAWVLVPISFSLRS